MRARWLGAAALGLALAACGQMGGGTTQQTAAGPAATQGPAADQSFVANAASGGLAEVESARLALERSSSPEIQSFARTLLKDHAQNNERLRAAASNSGISMPSSMTTQDSAEVNRLASLQGRDFDREFARQMVEDHQETVRLFERQVQQGSSPELKTYARNSLPALQQHLTHAQSLVRRQG